jgi:hypothetical protein
MFTAKPLLGFSPVNAIKYPAGGDLPYQSLQEKTMKEMHIYHTTAECTTMVYDLIISIPL